MSKTNEGLTSKAHNKQTSNKKMIGISKKNKWVKNMTRQSKEEKSLRVYKYMKI